MARSTQTTRSLNGEELVSRIRKSTNSFKAGRFMPVSTRPWVSSVFLMSRINYRTCALNLRQQDIQKISSAVKSWVMQGFLIRPPENILFRNTNEGANLIKTFISQAEPSSKYQNSFLTTLFRTHVSKELPANTIRIPSYYSGDFFEIIREVWREHEGNLLCLTTRQWQDILLQRGTTHVKNQGGVPALIALRPNKKKPNQEWIGRRAGNLPGSEGSALLKSPLCSA